MVTPLRGMNFTITVPTTFIAPAQPAAPKDTMRIAVSQDDGDCFTALIEKIKAIFRSIADWIAGFSDSPIDPALFAKWDAVVEKDYDLVGATNPRFLEAANIERRGKTLADHFIKAVSKTGVQPQATFRHVFVSEREGAGILFTSEGAFSAYSRQARSGEFNNPDTFIIIGFKSGERLTAAEKESYKRERIAVDGRDGRPYQNAKILILSGEETATLQSDRMPASALAFLNEQR